MAQNSIRDIQPSEHRRTRPQMAPPTSSPEGSATLPRRSVTPPPRRIRRRKSGVIWKVGSGILVLVVLLFATFSFLFAGAELTVTQRSQELVVSGSFTALNGSGSGDLSFEVMTEDLTESRSVPATGKEFVEEKAQGKIIIFNDYSSADQRLIRNTRFETPEGLIYRIDESVVVPGQTILDGGETSPGSMEVTIFADEAGDTYNSGLTDFTIPGFKGAPQFEHFYAQSKTAMAGGFIGEKLIVEESVLAATRTELQTSLKDQLLNQVTAKIPEGFLLFEDGIFIEFTSIPATDQEGQALLSEKATLYGVLFKETDLARHLAAKVLTGFDGGPVRFLNASELTLTVTDKESARPWETNEFSFDMNGSGLLLWTFDENKLIQNLTGRNKEAIHTILSGYPSIDKAEAVIRPFWRTTFPNNSDQITINRVLP